MSQSTTDAAAKSATDASVAAQAATQAAEASNTQPEAEVLPRVVRGASKRLAVAAVAVALVIAEVEHQLVAKVVVELEVAR